MTGGCVDEVEVNLKSSIGVQEGRPDLWPISFLPYLMHRLAPAPYGHVVTTATAMGRAKRDRHRICRLRVCTAPDACRVKASRCLAMAMKTKCLRLAMSEDAKVATSRKRPSAKCVFAKPAVDRCGGRALGSNGTAPWGICQICPTTSALQRLRLHQAWHATCRKISPVAAGFGVDHEAWTARPIEDMFGSRFQG